uniref:ribonuclease H n=1 Tax=Cyprinus carpio TaxID=7962 RepID=A0A8C1UUH3_CYPCA
MPGAKVFTILDAKCGFWQIPLDEASSKLTTFMSPFGRYRFLRMPYGISTGIEVFQRSMEQLFAGEPCEIVVDDILIWGQTQEEHNDRLQQVLNKIRAINIKLNLDKCKFRVNSVQYVGHLLTADGVKPDNKKTKAACDMPTPQEKQALQQLLGMTNYLSKFIPQYSDITGPLRQLLHQDSEWCWHETHDKAFARLKQALTNAPVLQYFDTPNMALVQYAYSEGRPVAFASRALMPTESLYAQIEKEMLALVFATKKIHDFIYGHPVTVETDHQPLITILKKPLHTASPRLQGVMMKLHRYHLDVIFKHGKELFVANALSRAHLSTTNPQLTDDLLEVMTVQVLPIV